MASGLDFIVNAGAWSNGEVAYIAWRAREKIPDCLGFMITRVHETGGDAGKRRILPTWVSFKDQSNPDWNEQDASVWPIQRFEWRDLTLRKSRDTTKVRPIDFKVHYEIVPVGLAGAGRTPVPPSETAPAMMADGKPSFIGPARQLFQIGKPFVTNSIAVTHDYGEAGSAISATFTNGILSTQNLVRQLQSVARGPSASTLAGARAKEPKQRVAGAKKLEDHLLSTLKKEIADTKSPIRAFLTGDALTFVQRLIERARTEGGEVYLALYELHDEELIGVLLEALKAKLVHIILSTAGSTNPNAKDTPKDERQPVVYDTENDSARRRLHAAAKGELKGRVIDRMFNSSARIGHNKFAVLVQQDKAVSVMTGSTNWTETGLCAQSNNVIIIDNEDLAGDYFSYWERLRKDRQPERVPLTATGPKGNKITGSAASNGRQRAELRTDNVSKHEVRALAGKRSTGQLWCSPNTPEATVPKTAPKRPPDLTAVYKLMNEARQGIFFLTFLPGLSGKNNIIGEAAALMEKKKNLFVMGAVSDPKALPPPDANPNQPDGYTDAKGKKHKLSPPAIWWPHGEHSGIAMIRAAALKIPFGNMRPELLTAGHAIIHDKIIVIDPLDPERCAVITGSHNLGYKASYCNDDNLLIIRGNPGLATAYAVHVIDIYDHYVFRARLEETIRQQIIDGKIKSYEEAAAMEKPQAFLRTDACWQDRFLNHPARSSLDYFLAAASPKRARAH